MLGVQFYKTDMIAVQNKLTHILGKQMIYSSASHKLLNQNLPEDFNEEL